jgi:hypothetical protein
MEIFHREKKGVTLIIISYDVVVVRYNEPFSKMLFHSRFLIYVNVLDDESFSSLESPFRGGSLLPSPSLSLSILSFFWGVCVCVVKRVTGGGSIPVLYTQVTTFCAGIWDGKHSESIYVGGDKRACHSLVTTNPHVCVCVYKLLVRSSTSRCVTLLLQHNFTHGLRVYTTTAQTHKAVRHHFNGI